MALQETMRALADPTRREILNLLKGGRMSAGEIASHFQITMAGVSRHLNVLKDAGLVRIEREGKFIYYELTISVLEEAILWMRSFQETGERYETAVQEDHH